MRKSDFGGLAALLGVVLVSGCHGDEAPRHKAADDARDVAMVQRMNQTPFRPIRPEPFSADDLAQYDLARSGCAFRPGNNPDEPPLFVAQSDRGFLKLGGVLKPLAVKTGSAELPSGAHAIYMGMDNWIELVAQAGGEGAGPDGKKAWPSRLVIHDAEQRVAFNAAGQVSCAETVAKD